MKMSDAEIENWCAPLREDTVSTDVVARVDHVITLPDTIGEGCSYSTDLGEQCKLMLTDIQLLQETTFEGQEVNLCGVFIMLKGELTLEISGQAPVTVDSNSAGLFFIGDSACNCTYSAGHIKMINFSVDVELMASLARQYDSSPAKLGADGQWQVEDSLWTMPLTTAIGDIIEQIYRCQLAAHSRKIYIQAKLMEILTLLFDWREQQKKRCGELSPGDQAPIMAAARLIEDRMANPPSLSELAREVGINDNKLKKAFKQVFNETVFGYLHQKRMERAKQLLANSEYSVKEVAAAVGFKHQGHFAAQFKTHWQVTPTVFLKKYRQLVPGADSH